MESDLIQLKVNPINNDRAGKAACGTRGACGHYFRTQDIVVQKSRTYVAIADLCGDFDLF